MFQFYIAAILDFFGLYCNPQELLIYSDLNAEYENSIKEDEKWAGLIQLTSYDK